jgi:hypothetical protein
MAKASGLRNCQKALDALLHLCIADADAGVTEVMTEYGLSRQDLKSIYAKLRAAGLGSGSTGTTLHCLLLSNKSRSHTSSSRSAVACNE